ncbi:MerR family transcriptional regulator [Clostridium aminobutyricum]|uniref:MerR family transcriptional regulator n=1 Tax=Clostridium aminobutyricum TaxID=33953 RepID=A0A939DB16_CLOAM|nr:GyrI-like domain-containing protein [Clostridium aminobutyricum]MBN7774542.1 MerR family transcriptional regulator [Clostridium aminobutyricum]
MEDKEYYSVGEVSKICNISKKAVRFYDKIGLISPDKVCDDNNYRFYNRKTLLSVPIIKYYKQMGFKLEEMRSFLEGGTYSMLEKAFRQKIDNLKEMESEIFKMYTSVKDWYDLILEAEMVIENNVREVAVKYIDASNLCFMEQDFNYNYMESIVNIDFTNYIESIHNEITGPVMISFPSFKERMEGKSTRILLLQKTILPCQEDEVVKFGGYMVASCYHIGAHETINDTYQKICDWAAAHGYKCAEESYERYVTDYWTTRNSGQFVTEIMIKVTRE